MSSAKWLLGIALILGTPSCASLKPGEWCELTPDQVQILKSNLGPVLAELSDDDFIYEPYIHKDRYIYKQQGQCWCMLSPKPRREGYWPLHGEYSVDVDVQTMNISKASRIVY